MRLSELKYGQTAVVTSVSGEIKAKSRLGHLGLIKGVEITVIRRAPFGDPIEIKLRGFCLAIRKNDADKITVI